LHVREPKKTVVTRKAIQKYIYIHRVSYEERSIFCEVIVSVILSKKVYIVTCFLGSQPMQRFVAR
jgi:hypothetical protein